MDEADGQRQLNVATSAAAAAAVGNSQILYGATITNADQCASWNLLFIPSVLVLMVIHVEGRGVVGTCY